MICRPRCAWRLGCLHGSSAIRLITRKIWRAFPELDRFSDEQCQRFVKAAGRQRWFVFATWGAVTVVFAAGLALASVLTRWTDSAMRYDFPVVPAWMILFVVLTAGVAAAGLAAMLTRDKILRRRIALVLKYRGSCVGCRYSLVGLPVPDSLCIVCPECGAECQVDASLGELATGLHGERRFAPAAPQATRFESIRARVFNRRVVQRVGWGTAAVVLVLGSGAYWWESAVRTRAAAAAVVATRTPLDSWLVDHSELFKGNDQPSVREPLSLYLAALGEVLSVQSPIPKRGWEFWADMPIGGKAEARLQSDTVSNAELLAARAVVAAFNLALRNPANDQLLSEIAAAPIGNPSVSDFSESSLGISTRWRYDCYALAAVLLERFHRSVLAGDQADAQLTLRCTLRIASFLQSSGTMDDFYVGIRVRSSAAAWLIASAGSITDAELLAKLALIASESQPEGNFPLAIDGHRYNQLWAIAKVFADPNAIRFGDRSMKAAYVPYIGSANGIRFGTFAQVQAGFDRVIANANSLLAARVRSEDGATVVLGASNVITPDDPMFVAHLAQGIDGFDSHDQHSRTELRSAAIILAIEHHYRAHGRYPASLADVAAVIPGIRFSTTPSSLRPEWRYQLLTGEPDGFGRQYQLTFPGGTPAN